MEAGNSYLNENERKEISQEIEALEKSSCAELVAVITNKSSSYKNEIFILSISFTFLLSILILFVNNEYSSTKLLQWQMISFFSSYFILKEYENLVLKLLPKKYKYKKASNYAKKQFFNLGLHKTNTKCTLMFFVSLEEKYVQILTDKKINDKIPNSYWESIIDDFVKDVKQKRLNLGYLKAIKACKDKLISYFPLKPNDINELSNEIIQLRY